LKVAPGTRCAWVDSSGRLFRQSNRPLFLFMEK
jgi:hypothetical protein